MQKTLSGSVNLNTFTRGQLQNGSTYRGRSRLPAIRSEPRYAGAGMFVDSPINYAYGESRMPSMKRQARPYGVY